MVSLKKNKIRLIGLMLCFSHALYASEPKKAKLIIETASPVSHHFEVTIADSLYLQQQGLMQVTALAENQGMIFTYPTPRKVSMWMKNTLIPLDMLFINEQYEIIHYFKNALPHDQSAIDSKKPVIAVLEISGGLIEALDISLGDKVYWSHLR